MARALSNSKWSLEVVGGVAAIQGNLTRLRVSYVEAMAVIANNLVTDMKEKTTWAEKRPEDSGKPHVIDCYVLTQLNIMSWRIENRAIHANANIYGNSPGGQPWKSHTGSRTISVGGRVMSRQGYEASPSGSITETLLNPEKIRTDFIRTYRAIQKADPSKRVSLKTAQKRGIM